MKNHSISIKTRVIFWYSFSMIMIIALVLFILILAGRQAAEDDARSSLIISTDMAVNNVTIQKGKLIIDDDFIYYMDNTWITLTRNDVRISGLTPEGFPENVAFEEGAIRLVRGGRQSFYVYDRLIENRQLGKIWIRGMTPADLSVRDPALSRMIRLLMIVLPVLILLSLLGGWLITQKAFQPLKQVNETVSSIQEGSDLSRRIRWDTEKPRDEIQATAAAFDRMLDRIENSFEREKQFTNDASHELRTPVSVIQAECEYALDNIENPEEVAASIRAIHGQSGKMSSLIDQLLLLARADRSAIRLNLEEADISLLAEEAAFAFRKEAQERNISIQVDAPAGTYLIMDVSLISRALENLISNGVKYGKEGGKILITVQAKEDDQSRDSLDSGSSLVHDEQGKRSQLLNFRPMDYPAHADLEKTALSDKAGYVLVSVWDNGIGIEEKDLDQIWNRFYRAESTGRIEGQGLGLSIVRWIVEAHGGKISVCSEPGVYTEFNMILPIQQGKKIVKKISELFTILIFL